MYFFYFCYSCYLVGGGRGEGSGRGRVGVGVVVVNKVMNNFFFFRDNKKEKFMSLCIL